MARMRILGDRLRSLHEVTCWLELLRSEETNLDKEAFYDDAIMHLNERQHRNKKALDIIRRIREVDEEFSAELDDVIRLLDEKGEE